MLRQLEASNRGQYQMPNQTVDTYLQIHEYHVDGMRIESKMVMALLPVECKFNLMAQSQQSASQDPSIDRIIFGNENRESFSSFTIHLRKWEGGT